MATQSNRITFTVTPNIRMRLDALKKQIFYSKTRSDMIRMLIEAGIDSITESQANTFNKPDMMDSDRAT